MEDRVIKIFKNKKFGKIRVVIIDGRPWFVAVDVCKALEIKNSRDAVSRLDEDEKKIVDLNMMMSEQGNTALISNGGWIKNNVNIINESGLYSLIMRSRLKNASEFKHWITSEVFPSVRQLGIYTTTQIINKIFESAQVGEQIQEFKCVYVFEMNNNTVKIGYTKNIRQRMQTISSSSGLEITNAYATEFVDSERAYLVEQACHEYFDSRRIKGEFFKVPFAEAVEILQKTFDA